MQSFKEFLLGEAKRKPKEPDWPDADYQSGYSRLRDMQSYLTRKDLRTQLFVPKRRDPKVMRELETQLRLRQVDKELREESIPILTAYHDAPPGNNKPGTGFWTSTAIQTKNGWTSDWYKYVKNNHSGWQTDYGFLFDVVDSPMVFDMMYAKDYYEWALDRGRITMKGYAQPYTTDDARHRFPWDQLARHFDAAHLSYAYRDDDITYGWDVESTVWFKTKFLKYKGAVRLNNYRYEDDEE
jgi:hypothetical protein